MKTHLLIILSVNINTNGVDLFSYFEIFAIYFEILNTQFWLAESKLKLFSSIRSFKHEGRHPITWMMFVSSICSRVAGMMHA